MGCLTALCATQTVWSKTAEKPLTLSLSELGQQSVGGRPQTPGSTQATVHFVGDHHVLVTFPVRRLMKRLADCDPEDEDRMIDAVLVDVPSGKVAARTSWRVHDSGQYLWDLGRGHFLLRVKNRLLTVAPLANLSTEKPFEERQLLAFNRQVLGVLVSAEGDLLTVETRERPYAKAAQLADKQAGGLIEINFYRLEHETHTVEIASAGRIMSTEPVEIPMTREGYLDASEEAKGRRWVFDYIAHGGAKTELAPYDTSCFPQAKFVSKSEFVAFGCHGSTDKIEIGGFNMRGEQMWQQNFFEPFAHPSFSFAPEAGRFALGRALTLSGGGADPSGEGLTGQDVVVMQAESGKQVFHTVVTPAQRTGQNFALASDGMEVAVIRAGVLEVHRLAPLSAKDQQALKAVRDMPIERAAGPILLPTRARTSVPAHAAEAKDEAKATAGESTTANPAPAQLASPPEPANPPEHTAQTEDQDQTPRKPPTLYAPDEVHKPQ